jgi:hypothetical protein
MNQGWMLSTVLLYPKVGWLFQPVNDFLRILVMLTIQGA